MHRHLSRLCAVVLLLSCVLTSTAQQVPPLSRKTEAVKRKAESLTAHAHISVLPRTGEEEFGDFLSNDQEGFTFFDVDRKAAVTLRYEDVRKIKDGYGGYNSIRRRHTDRTKAIIVGVAVVAGLGALVGGAAAAK